MCIENFRFSDCDWSALHALLRWRPRTVKKTLEADQIGAQILLDGFSQPSFFSLSSDWQVVSQAERIFEAVSGSKLRRKEAELEMTKALG